ncbi:MAG TPA: hypothetical protein VGM88_01265 [Kofleriaceae bacterium]|jgi:hypothetical protein
MTNLNDNELRSVVGGVDLGGACTLGNPSGAAPKPPQQFFSMPSAPAPSTGGGAGSGNIGYSNNLEHALHGRPPAVGGGGEE